VLAVKHLVAWTGIPERKQADKLVRTIATNNSLFFQVIMSG
jgi:hypothetical protein